MHETPGDSATPDWGQIWQHTRGQQHRKDEVLEAVEVNRRGKSWDDVRALLEDEMEQRRLPPDPIWVERTLDQLGGPQQRARQRTRRIRATAKFASRLVQLQRHPAETLGRVLRREDPEWMRPPAGGMHYLRTTPGESVAVTLDPAAEPILASALAGSTHQILERELVGVTIWLDSQGTTGLVAVHLGAHRIGTFDARVSERLRPAMQSAADVRMKVRAFAQAAAAPHRNPPYLVVVKVPALE